MSGVIGKDTCIHKREMKRFEDAINGLTIGAGSPMPPSVQELQAEITRLRALAVRVRKIEWVDRIGNAGSFYFEIRERLIDGMRVSYYWELLGEDGLFCYTTFDTVEAAKAACQSALEAWIGQFVEVREQG